MTGERIPPRIAVLDPDAPRLDAPAQLAPPTRWPFGTLTLGLAGLTVLVVGFSALSIGNFVTDQFARAAALGWMTLAVAAAGGGLVATGIAREIGALLRLEAVDHLHARLADPATTHQAALDWLATLPDTERLAATIRTVNDPTSVLALLRDGPAADLRTRAEALGQEAAVGVFALTAAMPSPVLDAMVVIWRGLRLIRDVAALHGMRPGLLGTVALLRRTLASASVSALTNVAVDTGMRMLVSHPTIARLSGDAAGAMVAARRMMVLARAAAAACSPLVTND